MVEGTVHTLLEDDSHHIRGVSYRDKDSGEMKVSGAKFNKKTNKQRSKS